MSNNLMYIQCDICKEVLYISKYYPRTNWYLLKSIENGNDFEDFFSTHHHEELTMRGPIHFSLRFEFGEDCPNDFFGYLERKIVGPNRFTGGEK